jgi:formylglycine-generating enzyme required for sulfatase activity
MKILGRRLLLLVATAWMLFQLGAACQAQPRETFPLEIKTETGIITLLFKKIDPTPPVLTGNPVLKEQLKKAQDELKLAEEAADAAKTAAANSKSDPNLAELEKEKQETADKAATKVKDLMKKMVPYESSNGFFMAETELSQEQYAAILGQERLEEIKTRLTDVETLGEELAEDNQKYLTNGHYPVFGNRLSEAVEVCRKVESLKNAQHQDAANSTIRFRVRLPSHYEWQYACRAAPVSSRPHFYQWRKYDDLREENVTIKQGDDMSLEKLCDEVWKDIHPTSEQVIAPPFVGSQEQVFKIMEKLENNNDVKKRHMKILSVFLRGTNGIGLDNKHDLSSGYDPPIELIQNNGDLIGNTNSWGLRHMSTNLSEWVLHSSSPENISSEWSTLVAAVSAEKPTADQLAALRKFRIGIAGGGTGLQGVWKLYTIWHVDDINFDKNLFSKSSNDLDVDFVYSKKAIRLLMETVLADTWLISIRAIIFKEGDNAQNALAEARDELMLFAPVSERTQVLGKLDYYGALNYLQRGENAKARAEFKKTETLADEDPYFHFLQIALDAESS